MTASSPEPVLTPPGAAAGPAAGRTGLRERKKARTRSTIRSEAIRLFAEQGFGATTVEQIADAADVSASTFFRYFPSKEKLVTSDEYDPLVFEAFLAQPPEVPPVRAFRAAIAQVLGSLSEEARAEQQLRHVLMHTEPAVRSAMLDEFAVGVIDLGAMLAGRMGRPSDDLAVRTLAGAIIGVSISVLLGSPGIGVGAEGFAEINNRMDAALALLEALPV